MNTVRREFRAITALLALAALVAVAAAPVRPAAAQTAKLGQPGDEKIQTAPAKTQAPPALTAAQMLNTALSYYFNDDSIEKSLPMFQELRSRYGGASEGATAAYYIGLYYHRMFYIEEYRKGQGRANTKLLEQASSELDTYLKVYAAKQHNQWAADARFERFLLYLRRGGRTADARNELKKIQEKDRMGRLTIGDPYIYIGRLVWSTRSEDTINYPFLCTDAAKMAQSVLDENPNAPFDVFVTALRNRLKAFAAQKRGQSAF